MNRTERNEKDDSQKIKIAFLSGAALILIILIISFGYTYTARNERDLLKEQLETSRQDNTKLEQLLVDQSAEIDSLKKQVQHLHAEIKARPVPEPKKTASAKKPNSAPKKKKTR
jgi:uncharacterized membrane protein YvbJ